jgi:uncharacterized protein YdaU (DUF1376 family)
MQADFFESLYPINGDEMIYWYKRDPNAWRAGVCQLKPEERGIYDTVIDVLYSYDGVLPPDVDDKWWARECNCDPRTWRAVRDRLITKGKLFYKDDGALMAKRVERELGHARAFSETQSKRARTGAERRSNGRRDESEIGLSGGQIPNENSERAPANTSISTSTSTSTSTLERLAPLAVEEEFEKFWKVYPKRKGSNPKQPAWTLFLRAIKNGVAPAIIVSAARGYAAQERERAGTPYIPMAKTWLNQRQWEDHAEQRRENVTLLEEYKRECLKGASDAAS